MSSLTGFIPKKMKNVFTTSHPKKKIKIKKKKKERDCVFLSVYPLKKATAIVTACEAERKTER